MTKFGIIGVGAVGGYFGAKLLQHGFDVNFLATPKSAKILKQNGLKVFSPFGDMEFAHINVSDSPEIMKDADVILICVKSQTTKEIAQNIKPYLKNDALVLSLQNGIENEEILSEILGKERIISAQVYISSASPDAGIIKHGGSGELVIGELNNQISKRIQTLQQQLIEADIPTKITENYKRILWLKLLVNSTYNGFSALLGDDFKKIPYCEIGKQAFYEMLKEGQAVANADGVNIEEKDLQKIMKMTNKDCVFFNFDSSTLQDVKKSKPLEIDFIQGAVIKQGERYGIPTPYNKLVYSLLKIREQKMQNLL